MRNGTLINMMLLASAVLCASCANDIEQSETTYLPFKSSSNGKYGLISTSGTVLFEEEFKDRPTSVMNDRFLVENGNGLWEIYTAEAKPKKVGDDYLQIADFTAEVTPAVKKGERIKLIDVNGNEKAVLEKVKSKNIIKCSRFHFGFAVIETEDDLSGIINTKGNVVVEPKYLTIIPMSSTKFIAMEQAPEDKESSVISVVVLDNAGKTITTMKVGEGQKYNNINLEASTPEYLAVCSSVDGERQWGYINLSKEVVVKPSSKIRGLGGVAGKNFIFYNGENYGVMNFEGETVLRAKYDNLVWADKDLLIAYDTQSKYSLINLEGEKLTKESYLAILPFYDGSHAAAEISDHNWGFINKKGEELAQKNMPDIHWIGDHSARSHVESDYVDIDAITSKLMLAQNGILGYTLNQSPSQVVKAYNEIQSGTKLELTPESNRGRDRLKTYESSHGLDISSEIYYRGYMTEYLENGNIGWSKETPAYIAAEVGGHMLRGKTDLLYAKISATVKSYGKAMRENSQAVIVKLSDDQGWVVTCNESRVFLKVYNNREYQDYNIDYYAKEGETTKEYIKPTIQEPEEPDAAVADSLVW